MDDGTDEPIVDPKELERLKKRAQVVNRGAFVSAVVATALFSALV
jgi:hypothetical protein